MAAQSDLVTMLSQFDPKLYCHRAANAWRIDGASVAKMCSVFVSGQLKPASDGQFKTGHLK